MARHETYISPWNELHWLVHCPCGWHCACDTWDEAIKARDDHRGVILV